MEAVHFFREGRRELSILFMDTIECAGKEQAAREVYWILQAEVDRAVDDFAGIAEAGARFIESIAADGKALF